MMEASNEGTPSLCSFPLKKPAAARIISSIHNKAIKAVVKLHRAMINLLIFLARAIELSIASISGVDIFTCR